MANLFINGNHGIDLTLQRHAAVLNEFREAHQNTDGQLVIQETALDVAGLRDDRAGIRADKITHIDAKRLHIGLGIHILIQHHLYRIKGTLFIRIVQIDMRGRVFQLDRAFIDLTGTSVHTYIFRLYIGCLQAAQVRDL